MQERPPRPAGDSPQPMRQRTPWAGCFDLGHGVRGLWSRRQHHSELSLSGGSFRETLPWAIGTYLSGKCIGKDLLGTVANWGPESACMHSPLPPLKGTELQGSHPHYTGCAGPQAPPRPPFCLIASAWPLWAAWVSAFVPNSSILLPQQASLIEQEVLLTRSTGHSRQALLIESPAGQTGQPPGRLAQCSHTSPSPQNCLGLNAGNTF